MLNSFLGLLSLYADIPASHQVLEYLIWRYRVNEMNSDKVIKCFLWCFDTKVIEDIYQILSFG